MDRSIFVDGYYAAMKGKTLADNPYHGKYMLDAFYDWIEGFQEYVVQQLKTDEEKDEYING